MGAEYVIDHVICEHNNRMEQYNYRNYTSDLLQIIAEQMGAEINIRYADTLKHQEQKQEKSADEIALDVIKRAGLKVGENGST